MTLSYPQNFAGGLVPVSMPTDCRRWLHVGYCPFGVVEHHVLEQNFMKTTFIPHNDIGVKLSSSFRGITYFEGFIRWNATCLGFPRLRSFRIMVLYYVSCRPVGKWSIPGDPVPGNAETTLNVWPRCVRIRLFLQADPPCGFRVNVAGEWCNLVSLSWTETPGHGERCGRAVIQQLSRIWYPLGYEQTKLIS